jgi:nucleoside 2-deoxyribosyltransferase
MWKRICNMKNKFGSESRCVEPVSRHGCMENVAVVQRGAKTRRKNWLRKKLYFAGPLFNQAELQFNEQLCFKLEGRGISVFLPQRDGVESAKPPYKDMSKDERRRTMFAIDRDEILKADIFLFILDGRVPDEGACVELGIAYAQRHFTECDKLLIGLQTDKRAAFLESMLNPMISQALDSICMGADELLSYLENYCRCNEQSQSPSPSSSTGQ